MNVTGLFHIAIKTDQLATTVDFYVQIIGLQTIERPDFGYPGAWLATAEGDAIIHIYAGGPALGPSGEVPKGTAAIDHVSLTATGFHEFRERIASFGLDWREFIVPGTSLWQLFVYDPSGVQLELTFDGRIEDGPEPNMSERRVYQPGVSFFNPEDYCHLGS